MSRYKDVDEILEAMDTWPKYGCKPDGRFIELTKETEADYVPYVHYDDMVQAVTGTPVQDVAPVVHAKWIEDEEPYTVVFKFNDGGEMEELYIEVKCPNCQRYTGFIYGSFLVCRHEYCPHCGAKMDGGHNDR